MSDGPRETAAGLQYGNKAAKHSTPDPVKPQSQHDLYEDGTPQDVYSARAKNQLHGKVTADKWNQGEKSHRG